MENAVHLKCACTNCGGIIQYLPAAAGQMVQCPRCRQRSLLPIGSPAEPVEHPAPGNCSTCGTPLDRQSASCPDCARRRRNRTLVLGLGSSFALLAIAAAFLALLNRPPPKKPASVLAAPKGPTVLPQPQVTARKSINDLKLGQFYLQQQRGSSLILAVGEIRNVSQNAHTHVQVDMDVFDARGAKIGTVSDINVLLRPGDHWQPLAKVTDPRAASVRCSGIREDP